MSRVLPMGECSVGITQERVYRQMRYQTLISPSPDTRAPRPTVSGGLKDCVGQVQEMKILEAELTHGRGFLIPLALLEPVTQESSFLGQTAADPHELEWYLLNLSCSRNQENSCERDRQNSCPGGLNNDTYNFRPKGYGNNYVT